MYIYYFLFALMYLFYFCFKYFNRTKVGVSFSNHYEGINKIKNYGYFIHILYNRKKHTKACK